jgi:hypothetical protein
MQNLIVFPFFQARQICAFIRQAHHAKAGRWLQARAEKKTAPKRLVRQGNHASASCIFGVIFLID